MSDYIKPLPGPTKYSERFWEAARRKELLLQNCVACGGAQHPPGPVCINCWSADLAWRPASGRGRIYSYTTVHRTTTPGFQEETPYSVAIVELDEGPRLTTNIVECDLADIKIDMPVEAVFDAVTADVTLIKFRPISSEKRA